MDNQKLENLLNLAIETPLAQREKSLNLNVGYEETGRSWEVIVKYNGDLSGLPAQGIGVEELIAGYAILSVPEELVDAVAALPQIEYVEKPKRLFFAVAEGKEVSCITPVTVRPPYLAGNGVLVAVIDSGIDYRRRLFRRADGTTRIRYLWDQTTDAAGREEFSPPEGFLAGTEFTAAQINEALALEPSQGFRLVPSTDVSGHGTAVAAIAAGDSPASSEGNGLEGSYEGVAPESELLIVKLGAPGENAFPRTTELMRALTYVVRKAQELAMPVAINLSFGNTYGAHDGSSLLERFVDNVSEIGRNVICVGSGNEGASAGHVQGSFSVAGGAGQRAYTELAVGEYETSLNVQLWKNYVDRYRVRLRAPSGAVQTLPEAEIGKQVVRMDGAVILIYLGQPTPYAVTQEVYFDLIPEGNYLPGGIWTFELETVSVVTGQYFFYLPTGSVRGTNTRFLTPNPSVTLTIPSTAQKVVTVGAYNSVYESYADFSGRGYVYADRTVGLLSGGIVKPDLVAPGVNIMVPGVGGGYLSASGTSFATPFVTGAAALLMEWGIVRGNDPFLYGEKVKAYLRRGAAPLRGESVYPNERVGFGALCVSGSIPEQNAFS